MSRRTSPIWKMPKVEFESLMRKSSSISEAIRFFGFSGTGTVHKMIKKRCEEDNIDISHIPMGINSNKGRQFIRPKIPLKKIMVKNSSYGTGHLKRRLLKDGILENKCAICRQLPMWHDKELVMRLDHINGHNNDHRQSNLRLTCPNCDSQLPTFAGRKTKKHRFCKECGSSITKHAKTGCCSKCVGFSQRKVERPSVSVLKKEVSLIGFKSVGEKYGVSGNSVRKWLKT